MNTVDKLLWYLFALSLFALALVFYVGLTTDANAFFSGLTSLWSNAMGRVNGTFQYAGGGSNAPTVSTPTPSGSGS
jgi:hypothetical protein